MFLLAYRTLAYTLAAWLARLFRSPKSFALSCLPLLGTLTTSPCASAWNKSMLFCTTAGRSGTLSNALWQAGRVPGRGNPPRWNKRSFSGVLGGPFGARSCEPCCRRIIAGSVANWPATRSINGSAWSMRWTRCVCPLRARSNALPTGCRPGRCERSSTACSRPGWSSRGNWG